MTQVADLSRETAGALPLPIEGDSAAGPGALLRETNQCRGAWSAKLLDHGALLFRGWGVSGVHEFRAFVTAFSGNSDVFGYAGGASPRSAVDRMSGVYSSTDYPPEMMLSLHNELSYTDRYPSRLYFFCLTAPGQGGETTLGDSRRILGRMDPRLLDKFRARQIRYMRNLSPHAGSGYSWQDAFETNDPEAAEERCAEIGATFEWVGDFLRISQVRPATVIHPETGEEVWFNQVDGFHPSALDPQAYREHMLFAGSEDRFRLNVSYGDGSPIDRAVLDHVRAAVRAETRAHRWQSGDILVLDNLLAAHGRMPFSGPRKIVVAMT